MARVRVGVKVRVGLAPIAMKKGEPPTPSPRSWTSTAARPACAVAVGVPMNLGALLVLTI
eukprot:scaffold13308_cov33-Phaeocystis_antarctica.AAC.1